MLLYVTENKGGGVDLELIPFVTLALIGGGERSALDSVSFSPS